jgi:hypothetical protein
MKISHLRDTCVYLSAGVGSVGITGDLKDQLEVVGVGIDIACLVSCLRKKLGHADILRPHSFPRDQFRSEWINTTRKS